MASSPQSASLPEGIIPEAALTRANLPKSRLTKRRLLFITHYFGEALGNATEAARLAGFRHPRIIGPRLRSELSQVIQEQEHKLQDQKLMDPREVAEKLTELARNHGPSQIKALELLARIHGMLSEKLDITVDRKSLQDKVIGEVTRLAGLLPQSVDVSAVESKG